MIGRASAVSALLMLGACTTDRPAPIAYDSDNCVYCHMQISDRRFAAVIVTHHGRTLTFDSIDCLRAFYANSSRDVASMWVSDFAHPGVMVPANRARYFDLGAGRAPMGKSHAWIAVIPDNGGAALVGIDPNKLRTWAGL
jgi:hypothetical protein